VQSLNKKTLFLFLKILLGILSFWIIYNRLNQIPELKTQFLYWLSQPHLYSILIIVLIMMPINWGIESYKWQQTTSQVESIKYSTSLKSVFAGICAGNVAPGRAIEFLAKIVFFKQENRPSITILHFINGMFQMLITVTFGIAAIAFKLTQNTQANYIIYMTVIGGFFMILFFCWAILNPDVIQKKIQFIPWFKKLENTQKLGFSKTLVLKLLALSIVRYGVFTTQFYLIYHALCPNTSALIAFSSIASYFMLTSAIPMISYIEPAIRAAIAIFVFNNTSDDAVSVVLASTFVWIINVVIPSIIGYIIIFREKIELKIPGAN